MKNIPINEMDEWRLRVELQSALNTIDFLKSVNMVWKKLADEKPTEEGRYVVARDGIVFDWIEDVTQDEIEQIHKQWKPYEVTHWLLIQPPKGEQK